MAVFHGDFTSGLRVSPDQQGPPMLPPHLASALGTSATDTSTLSFSHSSLLLGLHFNTQCALFACWGTLANRSGLLNIMHAILYKVHMKGLKLDVVILGRLKLSKECICITAQWSHSPSCTSTTGAGVHLYRFLELVFFLFVHKLNWTNSLSSSHSWTQHHSYFDLKVKMSFLPRPKLDPQVLRGYLKCVLQGIRLSRIGLCLHKSNFYV